MLNFRELFDDLGVEWRDRGKNTSRDNINISCPWCEDDPSYHLAVSEKNSGFYCYREPNRHSGKNINHLLTALGVHHTDLVKVRDQYDTEAVPEPVQKRSASKSEVMWQRFLPAAENEACIRYLATRGFSAPRAICRQYDLRFAKAGKWAKRLLLPIRQDGMVISWTGRAWRPDLDPKYKTEQTDAGQYIYIPRAIRDVLILVEGPMDALKIAAASSNRSVSSIALLGKGYSIEKLIKIVRLAEHCSAIYIALDQDVSLQTLHDIRVELRSYLNCRVDRLALPLGVKDPGEMMFDEINDWINGVTDK